MKIIIGFFGLSRSLRFTMPSIASHILAPITASGLPVIKIGHFNMPKTIDNPRSDERAIVPDRDEIGPLELDLRWVEPQNDQTILSTFNKVARWGDYFGDDYISLRNLCHQLRSLDRLWSLIELAGVEDDDIFFLLRPDLQYVDPLDFFSIFTTIMSNEADLIVPSWQHWGGVNDRFAFGNARAARHYATRWREVEEGCTHLGGMHAETFLRYVVERHGLQLGFTDMRALRVRANGLTAANDLTMLLGLEQ